MKCKECEHWQGNKYSSWADCYRIVGFLNEDLQYCFLSDENGTVEQYFKTPFDPHDAKYWSSNPLWKKLYEEAVHKTILFDKYRRVRVIEDVKDDIIFDSNNGERVGKLKLKYFQTHKEYTCHD